MEQKIIPLVEMLEFCKERNVGVRIEYDNDTENFIVEMWNGNYLVRQSSPCANMIRDSIKTGTLLYKMADILDAGIVGG